MCEGDYRCARFVSCAAIALLVLSSCWQGDAGFTITGNIRSASGEAVGGCLARVYDSDTNEVLSEERVGSELEMTVIYGVGGIGPIPVTAAPDRACVTVECDGYGNAFRSRPYDLADASYDQPIDLGVITLGD